MGGGSKPRWDHAVKTLAPPPSFIFLFAPKFIESRTMPAQLPYLMDPLPPLPAPPMPPAPPSPPAPPMPPLPEPPMPPPV